MKAIICTRYGSPDVLQFEEVEKPVPTDNEVLIKVHATTVNRTDCAMLRAAPFVSRFFTGMFRPRNLILGTEFAGDIDAVGKNVASYEVGDRVFGFDEKSAGSHAQYMALPADRALSIMPESMTYDQAAASIEGAHYAYNFINKADLEGGKKVLVNGATGGIGSAAVQLLKSLGAHVDAVCGTSNIDLVKKLGAVRVFDYTKEDFTEHDGKYDFVFDTVGKSSFAKCKPLLVPGGAYISSELGYMAQNIFLALITPLFGNKKVIFPLPTDCKGSLHLIKTLIEKGEFEAVIDRKYPLEQLAIAQRYVEAGQKIGNVVVTVKHP